MVEYLEMNGYTGYLIGSDGSVWTKKSKVPPFIMKSSYTRMNPIIRGKTGHLCVSLSNSGKKRLWSIHTLVLIHFIGPCPDGMECCHNDGNPSNNNLDNLRWDTHESNMKDRIKHGTDNNGQKSAIRKLDEKQVLEIKEKIDLGYKNDVLGKEYGVDRTTIGKIKQGLTWKYT